jgi:phospholipid/cholesterol/gamma-HCH transport system permease protein
MNIFMERLTAGTGKSVMAFVRYIGGVSILTYESFAAIRQQSKKGVKNTVNVVVSQTLFTGVEALPLVACIAVLIGLIVIVQSVTTMPKLGAGDFFGKIFVLVVIRELGPLLTSVIVSGRSGSALATYIGNMKVNQEIEALEVMGISPVSFLVMPAMLGALISMFCLTMFFDLTAVLGGYCFLFVGKVLNISAFNFDLPFVVFISKIFSALSTRDVLISFIKCLLFAVIISIISCYQGLNLTPSFTEVPKATRKAVVQSLVITMLFNSFITLLFYSYGR